MSRSHGFLGLAAGILMIAGSACGQASGPPESRSSSGPITSPAATAAAASSPTAAASAAPSAPETTATAAPRLALPVRLLVPAIHVDAAVENVGETPDGAMDVPKKWEDVAWYALGYRPGERGSAVVAGHLDSTTDRAVFWDLHKLQPGDRVTLRLADNTRLQFSVLAANAYPYNQAPLSRIFGPADVPMLNLITCNGTFDRASKNYDKRLVVYTKEVGA